MQTSQLRDDMNKGEIWPKPVPKENPNNLEISGVEALHMLENSPTENQSFTCSDSESHSKWDQFRQVPNEEFNQTNCVRLLREMEMEDFSDSEDESKTERSCIEISSFPSTKRNLLSDLEECVTTQEKAIQKHNPQAKAKKVKWGPEPLMERPRRNIGDNRTITQKAANLKSFKNLDAPFKGTGNSFAALDPQHLSQITSIVGVSLGNDVNTVTSNINHMKQEENDKSNQFTNDFPEIMLPSSLEVESSAIGVNTCSTTLVPENTSLQAHLKPKSWSQIVQNSIDAGNNKIVKNDRSLLEHQKPK